MRRWMGSALVLLAACAGGDAAPVNTEEELGPAVAEIAGLDRVRHVVELPDGGVVAVSGGTLVRLDFEAGTVDSLGRSGQGPGEYEAIGHPFLRGGVLWGVDQWQQRLVSWSLEGTPGAVVTFPVVIVASPFDVDTLGRIYYEQASTTGFVVTGQEVDSTRSPDSTWVFRFTPPDTKRDTVARLFEVGWEALRLAGGGVARLRRDYASADQWGVLADGTLWIARGQQNRVDRRAPDGTWTIGVPRPWTPVTTVEADRRYFRARPGSAGISDSVARPMSDTKGPFSEAIAAPDGAVWTRIQQSAGHDIERYAVFPVNGSSTRTVTLGPGLSVVGISAQWVYAAEEDEVGLHTLRRYERPPR